MPRSILTKARFVRAYHRLSESQRRVVDSALRGFDHYLKTQQAAPGLGVKHLGRHTYEFRAGLDLRIIYLAHEEQVVLVLLGTHDEVRDFLKNQ